MQRVSPFRNSIPASSSVARAASTCFAVALGTRARPGGGPVPGYRGQQGERMRLVGYVVGVSDEAEAWARFTALREGLAARG